MQIRHILPSTSSRATVEGDRAFFMRNQSGDMLTFYTTPQSRYEGWFIQGTTGFIKLLERIEVLAAGPVEAVTNTGQTFFWEYEGGLKLGWKLLGNHSGLSLSLSQPATVRLVLDIRQMYSYVGLGRQYEVSQQADGTLVQYSDPELGQTVYLHLRSKKALELRQSWQEQEYPRDAARHSDPVRLFTYTLAEVSTDFISLGAGFSPQEAAEASLTASQQRPQHPQLGSSYTHDILLNQVSTARATAEQALRWLQTEEGIYAGLPWFHQVWSRDELIAALGYSHQEQRLLIESYLGLALDRGQLPTYRGSGSSCADGVGWLCLLIREHGLEGLDSERLLRFLSRAHQELKQSRQASHGLIASEHNATWMDTIGREGFRLEIQAMYALLLELLFMLTQNPAYEQERIQLLGRIRQYFWHPGFLADGLGDPTLRPNVFLAYLLQPDLLNGQAWIRCFDTVLQALHCSWGGLSSVDRLDSRFHGRSTGEDNQSYHNGDSWFFINNLAAIAMRRLNQRHYGKQIVETLQSSTDEILWENMLGQPGEISSADCLESYGCGIQAFSAGTYLALLKEMESYSERQDRESTAFFWESTAFSTAPSRSR